MEQREEFSLDGVTYEAFNTSGGLGTLCATYSGRVRTLNYKTIRYPGHASIMKVLLNDLNLRNRRDTLKDILEQALPSTNQDVVVVVVTASGYINGRLMQETHAQKIYSGIIAGRRYSAIQLTTAAGICTVLDMLATGMLPSTGFIRQEDVALGQFLENRFGRYYKPRPNTADEPERLSQSEPENGPNDNFLRPVSMKNRG
ncbi:saccharopine dehydrogenase family protein [Serratia sarumanii]|uniref:saccharopine dehydrogenase family protein n=1 Tax=Serratia sarumanii TaxID=3020826 RepID=UPI003F811EDE